MDEMVTDMVVTKEEIASLLSDDDSIIKKPKEIAEELKLFIEEINKINFRHELKSFIEVRKNRIKALRNNVDKVSILEQKRAYETALNDFEKDTAKIIQQRYEQLFEPSQWFEIETGKCGPVVYAMSVSNGILVNVENQSTVYVGYGKIYKVKDKYYLGS